jgi:superfamily II DNA or RNA helicase
MNYSDYIEARRFTDIKSGFSVADDAITASLKPHQKYLVKWALLKGRAAVFADTGLGKTRIMAEWARLVASQTGGRVLFLSPLAVAPQTVIEASYVGVDLHYSRADHGHQFTITNYEMIDKFDMSRFVAIVLDESSILKNFDGRTRAQITSAAENIPYRLSCTATPSPNDYMELGNQSEFLGVMPRSEMLAMFFKHDGSDTATWALKGHGRAKFWEWLSTWAAVIRSPADLGLDGSEYQLPKLHVHYHQIPMDGPVARGMSERRVAKRESMPQRVAMAATFANMMSDAVLVWCHLNDESSQLAALVPDAVEVTGSDKMDVKESSLIDFSNGTKRVMITKPSIAGFGINWQHCNTVVFAGLTDSFEQFYQAIRRCYRFGQTREVHVHCFLSTREQAVVENLIRKENQHNELSAELSKYMAQHVYSNVVGTFREYTDHVPMAKIELPYFLMENAA